MTRLSLRAPSPSMAVAMTALFISLGGTGYAASQLGHEPAAAVAKKKKKKKPPAHPDSAADKTLFNSLFSAKIPGSHVAFAATAGSAATAASAASATHATSADSATNATHATSADSATNATTAGSAPPFAYGDFLGDGSANTVNTHETPVNLSPANIDHIGPGVYCFKDLSFTPKTAMVTADDSFGANFTIASVIVATPGTTLAECNAGEEVRVRTVEMPHGASYAPPALKDEPFQIWLN